MLGLLVQVARVRLCYFEVVDKTYLYDGEAVGMLLIVELGEGLGTAFSDFPHPRRCCKPPKNARGKAAIPTQRADHQGLKTQYAAVGAGTAWLS